MSCSGYMHMQFNSLGNAERLKLITFVVFLFRVMENCKSALSEKRDNIGLCAVICYLGPKDTQGGHRGHCGSNRGGCHLWQLGVEVDCWIQKRHDPPPPHRRPLIRSDLDRDGICVRHDCCTKRVNIGGDSVSTLYLLYLRPWTHQSQRIDQDGNN